MTPLLCDAGGICTLITSGVDGGVLPRHWHDVMQLASPLGRYQECCLWCLRLLCCSKAILRESSKTRKRPMELLFTPRISSYLLNRTIKVAYYRFEELDWWQMYSNPIYSIFILIRGVRRGGVTKYGSTDLARRADADGSRMQRCWVEHTYFPWWIDPLDRLSISRRPYQIQMIELTKKILGMELLIPWNGNISQNLFRCWTIQPIRLLLLIVLWNRTNLIICFYSAYRILWLSPIDTFVACFISFQREKRELEIIWDNPPHCQFT